MGIETNSDSEPTIDNSLTRRRLLGSAAIASYKRRIS
jgi:hypothetical protein